MGKFRGLGVAMVTPFTFDGEVDYVALEWLIEDLIEKRVDFLVPCGTTGESPTLSHEEHNEVIRFTVEKTGLRVPILAGTGSNSTKETIEMTKEAKISGVDGVMVVAPYYNKPTEAGIMEHYSAVAKIGLPVVLYDIPGRTGIKVSGSIISSLANAGIIHGLKWASGDLHQLEDVLLGCNENFDVLSGNDDQALDCMIRGGHGVISVIGNIIPYEFSTFVRLMQKECWANAKITHMNFVELMRMMFIESNPGPVKTAVSLLRNHMFSNELRLPMREMKEENKFKLAQCLKKYKLL